HVTLQWDEQDWRGVSAQEQAIRRARLIADDRRRGFAADHAPLLRVGLAGTGEGRDGFPGARPHLLLRRWATHMFCADVATGRRAQVAGESSRVPRLPAYREYIDWLSSQNPVPAEHQWRAYLAGVSQPTPVPRDGTRPSAPVRVARLLSEAETAALER